MPVDPVAGGLLLGAALDGAFGDPRRLHPVAGFGQAAAALERRLYAASRARGVAHEALLVGAVLTGAVALTRLPRAWQLPLTAATTWAVLGGRSLEREATTIHEQLARDDLDAARRQVRNLVGRDPSRLDPDEIARATVESLAENGSDAVVAPLCWGALCGIPGLLGHRAVNTLDAMIGHRSERYRDFGWAAARLDDLANWVPARVTVAATAVAGALTGTPPGDVLRVAGRDGGRHPSPNAGPVEAAFAAALGRRLGGINTYDGAVEDRGRLGDGPPVTVADIPGAVRLQRRIGLLALGGAVAVRLVTRRLRAPLHRRP